MTPSSKIKNEHKLIIITGLKNIKSLTNIIMKSVSNEKIRLELLKIKNKES